MDKEISKDGKTVAGRALGAILALTLRFTEDAQLSACRMQARCTSGKDWQSRIVNSKETF